MTGTGTSTIGNNGSQSVCNVKHSSLYHTTHFFWSQFRCPWDRQCEYTIGCTKYNLFKWHLTPDFCYVRGRLCFHRCLSVHTGVLLRTGVPLPDRLWCGRYTSCGHAGGLVSHHFRIIKCTLHHYLAIVCCWLAWKLLMITLWRVVNRGFAADTDIVTVRPILYLLGLRDLIHISFIIITSFIGT